MGMMSVCLLLVHLGLGIMEVWVWMVGLGWETMIVTGERTGWVQMIQTDWVGWLGMIGMLYVVD